MHNHDFYEFFYLLRGSMDCIVEGNRYALNEGSFLMIAPNELHRPNAIERREHEKIILWLSPVFLSQISQGIPDLAHDFLSFFQSERHFCPDGACRQELDRVLVSLLQEQQSQDIHKNTMCRCLLLQLLILCKRMHLLEQNPALEETRLATLPAAGGTRTDGDLNQVRDYINAHYTEDFTVSDLAERFFFNPNTLNRRFKNHTGMSVSEYIREKRLATAQFCIHQGMSAAKAGTAGGFSDYTTFYRSFCRKYGISPKAYAARIRNQPAMPSGDMARRS